MNCHYCGNNNPNKSLFCGSCGKSLKEKTDLKKSFLEKINELPSIRKKLMLIVILIVILSFIFLAILLANPVKKLEDNLAKYYDLYTDNRDKELVEIGRILKLNKDNFKVLKSLEETTHNITAKWVKNFNIGYKNINELDKRYQKISSLLTNLYNYYNGLEYVLDYELYKGYMEELDSLYNSKKAFLEGLEKDKNNEKYTAYYYYQKVIEEDYYYLQAKKYINDYVKDKIDTVKKEVEEMLKKNDFQVIDDELEYYLKCLDYLDENKIINQIDLSITEEYQKLKTEIVKKIVDTTKNILTNKESDLSTEESLNVLENVLPKLEKIDTKEYQELLDLKSNLENKKPVSLLDNFLVSSTSNSVYSKFTRIINNKEYDSYIAFNSNKNIESQVYKLNKEYKTFTATIIKDNPSITTSGSIIIYSDNKEIYKENLSNLNNLETKLELDIKDTYNLKIEVIFENYESNYTIYLVKPYLYR